jgi:hypothetical protein
MAKPAIAAMLANHQACRHDAQDRSQSGLRPAPGWKTGIGAYVPGESNNIVAADSVQMRRTFVLKQPTGPYQGSIVAPFAVKWLSAEPGC